MNLIESLLNTHSINNRLNVYLIENLPPQAWAAEPLDKKGRTIPGLVAHIHNVRLMWLKSIDKGAAVPEKIEAGALTPAQAVGSLKASYEGLHASLQKAFETDNRIKGFKPDATAFLGYLLAHDSHHRGQIIVAARQSGHPVSKSVNFGLWEWGSR